MKNILHLTLTKEWFDLMVRGIKRVEFREEKPYWEKRLFNRISDTEVEAIQFDEIHFRNGYGKDKPLFVTDHRITSYCGKVNRTRPFKLKTDYPCFAISFTSVNWIENYLFNMNEQVTVRGRKGNILNYCGDQVYMVDFKGVREPHYLQEFIFEGSKLPLSPQFKEFYSLPIK